VKELAIAASALREPTNYFAGAGGAPWCWPVNLIAFARKTRRDLQRRTFESRLHTRYVLVVSLETGGTLSLDSTPYRLRSGECHLIFPHQLHTYHDVAREDLLWLFVTFELPDDTPLAALRHCTVAVDADTKRLLSEFLAAYLAKQKISHRLQSLLSEILLRLVHRAGHRTPQTRRGSGPDERLLRTIHRHHLRTLPDALTVGELARLLTISESRLRTRFRENFGLSLGIYLRNMRLQQAMAMLRHSEASLTEIALACGFGSSSAFSRAFKKWSGTIPRDFRQSVVHRSDAVHERPRKK
jgi:AraC-like DNA-binding protein